MIPYGMLCHDLHEARRGTGGSSAQRIAWTLLACLLGAIAPGSQAADLNWDCDTATGIQPCSGSLDDKSFSGNGTTGTVLQTWPGGTSGLVLHPSDSLRTILVPSTRSIGKLQVLGPQWVLAGTGALQVAANPTILDIQARTVLSVRLEGTSTVRKIGGGRLFLGGLNGAWKGDLEVAQDTLVAGSDVALGDSLGATRVEAAGVLDLAGRSPAGEFVQLTGGALVNQDTSVRSSVQRLVVTADSRIGGVGGIDLRKGTYPNPFVSVKAGVTLSKTDTGNLAFHGIPLDLEGTFRLTRGIVSLNYGMRYQGTGAFQLDSATLLEFRNDSPTVVFPFEVRMNGADIGIWNGLASTEFAKDLVVSGDRRNVLNCTSNLLISGKITGTGRQLSKWSPAIVTLKGENTFKGWLVVDGGEVRMGNGTDSGNIAFDSIRNNSSFVFNHTGTKSYSGRINGAGVLAREGTGTTILTGTVAPASGTAIRSGTLQIGTGGAVGSISGTIDIAGTLVVDRSGTLVHSDTLRGSGSLVKRGGSTLVLAGSNAFKGKSLVEVGTLRIDASADSSAVEVRSGAILEGRGRTGAVDLQGTLRAGTDSAIGQISVASLAIPEFAPATIRVRARGTSKPGVEYDRVAVSGAVHLGASSRLLLDLTGLASPGTMTGIVQGAGIAGTFDTVVLSGDSGWIATLRYTTKSVDVVVVRDSSSDSVPDTTEVPVPSISDTLDTLVAAGTDTARLVVRGTVGILAPPRLQPRRVVAYLVDSILGHGIRGADTALVVGPATTFAEPLLVRMPIGLLPVQKRLAGEAPSVFRQDSAGRIHLVASQREADSAAVFATSSAGAFWLGYDTIPPVAKLVLDRDSVGLGQSARADYTLRDNVASSRIEVCLLLPGTATVLCTAGGSGDSLLGSRTLARTETPLGATLFARAIDSRRTTSSDSTDLVVFLDTLRAPELRLEDKYELLSLPYVAGNGSAIEAFRGLWGPTDARRWRAWAWDSAGFSEVLEGDPRALSGAAWWIRTRGTSRTWSIASTWTSPVSKAFETSLAPGWNLVGNPYGVAVDWSAVRRMSGLDSLGVVGPYLRDGSTQTWEFPDPSGELPAWTGVAIHNPRSEAVVLRIPSRPDPNVAGRRTSGADWAGVSLRWIQGNRSSSWIRLGLYPEDAGLAARSVPIPPAPEHALVGWIQGPVANTGLLGDFRVDRGAANEWTLRLEGVGNDAPLVLETVRDGGDTAMSALLRDGVSGGWNPLAPTMELRGGAGTRSFTLALGGPSRLARPSGGLAVGVRSGMLEWTLPAEGGRVRVRIELRDLAGRLVSVPVDEVMDPGSYRRVLGVPRASRARIVVLRAAGAYRTSHFADLR